MRIPKRKSEQYNIKHFDPYLSPQKAKELKKKLEKMLKKRPKLAQEVQRLALDGDFSENAPYQLTKGKLRGLNRKIDIIKKQLDLAIIINPDSNQNVNIGNTVDLQSNNVRKTYTILGSNESDPIHSIISYQSPLGSKLINKKVGDTIEIKKRGKTINYRITKIY